MNKYKLILISVPLITALGLAGCKQAQTPTQPEAQPTPTTNGTTQGSISKDSLRNLMVAGKPISCTYTDAETKTSGTMKIANNQVRGDFNQTVEDKVTVSHMISDGKTMYMWSDDSDTGMKFEIPATPTPGAQGPVPTSSPQSVDLDKTYDFQCNMWIVDPASFTPPTKVTFQDLSALMPKGALQTLVTPKTTGEDKTDNSANCAVCNSLTGEAKTSCTKALNCN